MVENYAWPGNVRELENVIRRALVVSKGDAILPGDLAPEVFGQRAPATEAATPPSANPAGAAVNPAPANDVAALAQALFRVARQDTKLKVIPAVERELVVQALLETRGNQVQAARLLGITRATLRKRIEKFKITQGIAVA
jgi:two-component system nitrogen regulation response regulator GlnG